MVIIMAKLHENQMNIHQNAVCMDNMKVISPPFYNLIIYLFDYPNYL